MSTERDDTTRLATLLDALTESVWELSEKEVDAELLAEGEKPDDIVRHVDELFFSALAVHRRERLKAARQAYSVEERNAETGRVAFPDDPIERRQLLDAVIARQPGLRGGLTMQHRDLETLTDEDVASALRDLSRLGALGPTMSPSDPDDE